MEYVCLFTAPWDLSGLTCATSVYIENHDHSRSVSRFGNDSPEWRALSAKLLAIMQTTQSGTLFVYQGEELGLMNFPRSWGIEEYRDVASINYWNEYRPCLTREFTFTLNFVVTGSLRSGNAPLARTT